MKKSLAVVTLTAVWILRAFCEEADLSRALDLEDALRLALERNPGLQAARHGMQAAEGRLLQAGVIPNPSISVEEEHFGGGGEATGFGHAETTVAVEQTIELGGKRATRKQMAGAEQKLAEWEWQARRLDVIKETTEHFVDVLAGQAELALNQEAWQAAENIYQTVSNRVAAGKDSPVEEAKSRSELALAMLTVDRARSRLTVTRKVLCAMWGDSIPAFDSVRGDLAKLAHGIPEAALLAEAMTRSPEWARWTDEIQAAELAVRAECRARIPDLRLGAGVWQSQADDLQALVASAEMELPVFDRKRGNILAAQAELERKRAEQETARTALHVNLAAAHELLTTMQKAAHTITQDALPAAKQAFAAAETAYGNGKIGYLDIQDARRSLIEVRRQQIETLAEYHRAVAQVERLAGRGLGEVTKQKVMEE